MTMHFTLPHYRAPDFSSETLRNAPNARYRLSFSAVLSGNASESGGVCTLSTITICVSSVRFSRV